MAEINVRQCFAFTKNAMMAAMENMKQRKEIKGCVMLSTCNRMELWVSLSKNAVLDLPEYICTLKELDAGSYKKFLKVREGEEAVRHLFLLSAGMKSQIVGEDQILTQIKEAAAFAREQECMDHVLEVLFRMAVTAGKQVKTEVPMDKANFSAAHQAIHFLKGKGVSFTGKKALVIGNGEMGRLTAQALMEEGCDVTVTVRQYRSGIVLIPPGAKRINYGERYTYVPECDFIFSATASPNFTITKEGLSICGINNCDIEKEEIENSRIESCVIGKKQIYVDLAVPRDIEESIAAFSNISLYDMDSFHMEEKSERMKEQYRQAEAILNTHQKAFYDWQESRDLVPKIQQIGTASGKEFCWRMEKELKELSAAEEEKEVLRRQMEQTAEKVVDKLLFALRGQVDTDTLRQCLEVFGQVYERE